MPLPLLQPEPTRSTLRLRHRSLAMRLPLPLAESVSPHPRSSRESSQPTSLSSAPNFLKGTSAPSSPTSKTYTFLNKELAMDSRSFRRSSSNFLHLHVYPEMLCWTDSLDLNTWNHTSFRGSWIYLPLQCGSYLFFLPVNL